jgi:FKBP-type peptidyl-prolyl cis-trans isomerase
MEYEAELQEMMILSKPSLNQGRTCKNDDLISMHFKGWMKVGIEQEKLVFDSKANGGKPTIFNNGQHIVPKCWEIASLFMHNGDIMEI